MKLDIYIVVLCQEQGAIAGVVGSNEEAMAIVEKNIQELYEGDESNVDIRDDGTAVFYAEDDYNRDEPLVVIEKFVVEKDIETIEN